MTISRFWDLESLTLSRFWYFRDFGIWDFVFRNLGLRSNGVRDFGFPNFLMGPEISVKQLRKIKTLHCSNYAFQIFFLHQHKFIQYISHLILFFLNEHIFTMNFFLYLSISHCQMCILCALETSACLMSGKDFFIVIFKFVCILVYYYTWKSILHCIKSKYILYFKKNLTDDFVKLTHYYWLL